MVILTDNNLKNTMGIYLIKNNFNGKAYIGSSVDIKTRLNDHIKKLTNNTHLNTSLQKEWNLFGSDTFTFEILSVEQEKSELPYKEKFFIDEFKKLNGVYNKNDPTEEFLINRHDYIKIKNKHVNNIHKKKINKAYVFGWTDSLFHSYLNKLHENLTDNLYLQKEEVDNYIFNNMPNNEIKEILLNNECVNEWYNSNSLFILNFPYHKKEFREIFGIIVEGNFDCLVTLETYQKIMSSRKEYIVKMKEDRRNRKSPLTHTKVTETENRQIKKVENAERKAKRRESEEVFNVFENKFAYLFEQLKEKTTNYIIVSFDKVSNYIYKKSGIFNDDKKKFDEYLKRYIRKHVGVSIYDFTSDVYLEETLNHFNIKDREPKILNKELGKEISEFNRILSDNSFNDKEI